MPAKVGYGAGRAGDTGASLARGWENRSQSRSAVQLREPRRHRTMIPCRMQTDGDDGYMICTRLTHPAAYPLVRALTLLFASLCLAAYTTDDSRPWHTPGAFFEDRPLQPIESLTSKCPVYRQEKGACIYSYPILEKHCETVETHELGVLGGSQYLLMQTLQSVICDEGQGDTYTCGADEAVLIEMPHEGGKRGKGRLVWHDATEREFYFISEVRAHSTPDGKVILDILYCMNGTGGCAQGLLLWTARDGWQRLVRDDSWEPPYERLPAGYRPHKSPAIDFGNMTWEQHLAGPLDPNCCPTGRVEFDLALVDDKLAVRSFDISVPPSEVISQGRKFVAARHASEFDPALPDKSFEEWLRGLLPKDVELIYSLKDCGERTADPGQDVAQCLRLEAEIISRARTVGLLFHQADLAFRSGTVISHESDEVIGLAQLSALEDALVKPFQPGPLDCPEGTTRKRRKEYAGLSEWCEDNEGQKHGPYRSWFSTGIYLMAKGRYANNEKTGAWIECSRFEHCHSKRY